MKQTIDLIYRRSPSGQVLTDADGSPVRVEDILSRIYRIPEGHLVLVRLRADDGRHEPLEFDMETLRAIQGHKIRGAFATEGGAKVNIYNSSIRGDWPILGATWDGIGLRWDERGNPDNGDPSFRLRLLSEVDPDPDFLEEGAHVAEEGNGSSLSSGEDAPEPHTGGDDPLREPAPEETKED